MDQSVGLLVPEHVNFELLQHRFIEPERDLSLCIGLGACIEADKSRDGIGR